MLMDGEKQARIQPSDILTNEYYQIVSYPSQRPLRKICCIDGLNLFLAQATSHYKELNASGMLSYNAKVCKFQILSINFFVKLYFDLSKPNLPLLSLLC